MGSIVRSSLVGIGALSATLLLPSATWAQCTDTFNFGIANIQKNGYVSPFQDIMPFGRGTTLSALTSTLNTVNTAFLTTSSAIVSAPNAPPDTLGGGLWSRGVAGEFDTRTQSTGTVDGAGKLAVCRQTLGFAN
jgi:hypothetical protein